MWQMETQWREDFEGAGARTGKAIQPDMAGQAVSDWVKLKIGFQRDVTQAQVLDSESKQVLLNCTRQWGKSTTTAAKAVHHAYTKPESLTLVVSPSARQSGEFVRKAAGFARRLGIR